MYKLLPIIVALVIASNADNCVKLSFDEYRTVCVCNSTYCDTISEPPIPSGNYYNWHISSKAGLRMDFKQGTFDNSTSTDPGDSYVNLSVDRRKTYQTMLGFGGAITDSAGLNIMKLSKGAQDKLMSGYYDPKIGIGYTWTRIPLGGSDFSTRPYTYDDVPDDLELKNFGLAPEDYKYKIPLIKRALELQPGLKLLTAVWSAPPWMKTSKKINGGALKREYYELYAKYVLRSLRAYSENGIIITAMTPGNEPLNSVFPMLIKFNSMLWDPKSQSIWLHDYFYPTIEKSEFSDLEILLLDDQRIEVPWWIQIMMHERNITSKVKGIAMHGYLDKWVPPKQLDLTHDKYPTLPMLMTEFCIGSSPTDHPKVILGSWDRAEQLCKIMFQNMYHHMTGWIDWNIALDMAGGPNWVNNNVDSPVIVNFEKDEFYRQPMFYVLAHFGKFVLPGSIRIGLDGIDVDGDIKAMAFKTPKDTAVLILYNGQNTPAKLKIHDAEKGNISLSLDPFSLHTITYDM